MPFKGPNTFHEAAKPIIQFNWLIGLGAYQQPFTTNTAYIFIQLYVIIFTLLHWTTTYIGLATVADFPMTDDIPSVASKMYQVLIYTNSCMAVTSPILIWCQKKGLSDCLKQIPILDDTFEAILGAHNDYRKQYIRAVCHIIVIVLVVFLAGLGDLTWVILFKVSLLKRLIVVAVLNYPMMIILVLDLNFLTFVRYLRKRFRDLNDSLLQLAEKCSTGHHGKNIFVIPRKASTVTPGCHVKDPRAERWMNDNHQLLREIRKVHLELCKLSQDVNHAYGMQNLLSMGIAFVIITGLLYAIYTSGLSGLFMIENPKGIASSVVWTVVYIFRIWLINHLSWSCSNEADRIGDVIYEILETRVDKELQKMIREFAVQIIQNPVRFEACGFFTLNYTFVQGVIGSVTTYLVILIQMS